MDFSAWAHPTCTAEIGGFRPPDDPLASWFGRVSVLLPGESWPTMDGAPMLPVAQLNLRNAPCSLPRVLADVAMITMFLGPWELPLDERNGVNWEFRAYASLEP